MQIKIYYRNKQENKTNLFWLVDDLQSRPGCRDVLGDYKYQHLAFSASIWWKYFYLCKEKLENNAVRLYCCQIIINILCSMLIIPAESLHTQWWFTLLSSFVFAWNQKGVRLMSQKHACRKEPEERVDSCWLGSQHCVCVCRVYSLVFFLSLLFFPTSSLPHLSLIS